MKTIKNSKRQLRNILLPLFVFMLILSTVLPSVASASGTTTTTVGIDSGTIIESNISGSIIELTLEAGKSWGNGIADPTNQAKNVALLVAGMTADVEETAWNTYKQGISIAVDRTNPLAEVLTVTLPATTYNITDNQIITMDISPVLIENWPGNVTPVTFKIHADPQISMGGSIMNGTTVSDLQTGGKVIELNLVNAKWNTTKINTLTELFGILDGFGGWDVAESIKNVDPNKIVSYTNDDRTLTIKLPPVPTASKVGLITFNTINVASLVIFDPIPGIVNAITPAPPLTFNIGSSGTSSLIAALTPTTEAGIKAGGATITLTLTGNKWSIDTDAKRKALIDALVAKDQPEQWQKVKNALSASSVVTSESNGATSGIDIATITLPAVAAYQLSANQTISLNVPYQLLEDNNTLNEVEFRVEATPKALISGTVTPDVSQADIIKGGKTIVVTLVNATWDASIATNTVLRENLLKGFKFDAAYTAIINAGANVVRTNDQVVTITLPPIAGFKIASDTPVAFEQASTTITPTPTTSALTAVTYPEVFKVTPVGNQSGAITGSIVSNANEFDIGEGGKVITITLKNDIWAKDAATQKVSPGNTENLLMSKFTLKDAAGVQSFKKDGINPATLPLTQPLTTVVRTSDTVMTITLGADAGFSLKDDAVAELEIPAALLSLSSNPIDVKSAFKISAVKAELPNKENLSLDKSDIQKGGKTITIALKNAMFNDKLDIEGTTKVNLINDLFVSNSNSLEWGKIEDALKNDPKSSIKISKDKITIKLPPVPDYNSNTVDTITLNVPDWVINHVGSKPIVVDGEIITGAVATARFSNNSFTNDLIKAGNGTLSITLTGTKWDPILTSNNSKKTALLKGFTVTDQTKEWALLSKEISSKAKFELTSPEVLKITLPAASNYSIIRNQVVDVVIPKSVLVDYKTDIVATSKLTITIPTNTAGDKSLGELNAVELADAITTKKRVIVPNKKVETIFVNTIEFPSSDNVKPSITTIEVTTTPDVQTVDIAITGQTAEKVAKVGNKSTFIYMNLPKNSDLIVSVFDGSSNKLQTDIYKKIGKGSKTYNEIPKKDYTGSYLVYDILTDKSLLKEILKYYSIDELKVTN